jgi:saccharopine dehydrogenase-like NADP-dependent oxidoreductase
VGSAIVADLARDGDFEVTAVDGSAAALQRAALKGAASEQRLDLGDRGQVRELAARHDLVVGAVPGPIGYQTLEAVIQTGTDVVDISFFAENPLQLNELAEDMGVTAVVDCGVAPGLSNMLLGFTETACDRVKRFICYVGGLPVDRGGLFQYKAPFSPIDVIAEYSRPARYVESGELRTEAALSQVEQIEVEGVGTLEAFLTDGLRTLLHTARVPDMREKTIRYPGHAAQMALLREMGLFGQEPVEIEGTKVVPRELAARLLIPLWEFGPGDQDITVMRVEIEAVSGSVSSRHVFELLDRYDAQTGTLSMARTTGYTCTAVVRLVASGLYSRTGISPPEYVGRDAGCFESVVGDLKARGIELRESVAASS